MKILRPESLESLLAVGSAVEEVVVHARHNALLVEDVRDTAVNGAEHSTFHFPLLAHLMIKGSKCMRGELVKLYGHVFGWFRPDKLAVVASRPHNQCTVMETTVRFYANLLRLRPGDKTKNIHLCSPE